MFFLKKNLLHSKINQETYFKVIQLLNQVKTYFKTIIKIKIACLEIKTIPMVMLKGNKVSLEINLHSRCLEVNNKEIRYLKIINLISII